MNIITRLIMDSVQYSGGLEKAQRSLDKYIQKNMSMENVVGKAVGTIGKLAAGIGVAMGAQEAFNKTIASTQTLTDEYGRTMEAAKVGVDTFFNSLALGDFSVFKNSIAEAITSAREFYNELDRLGSIQVFQDTSLLKIRLEMEKQKGILYDKSSTAEQKKAAAESIKALNQQLLNQSKILSDQATTTYYADLRKKLRSYGVEGSDKSLNDIIDRYFDSFTNYEDATKQYAEMAKNLEKANIYNAETGGFDYKYINEKKAEETLNDARYNVLRGVSEIGDEALKEAKNYERIALSEQLNAQTQINANMRRVGKVSGGTGGSKKELGVESKEQWKGELVLNTYIQKTAETQLDDEIFEAIKGDKKLPVLMQPVQELIEAGRDEGPEEGEDAVLSGLRSRIGLYDMVKGKISSLKDLKKYANEEEAGYLQEQITMWENYAESIGMAVEEGDKLEEVSGIIGQIGSALSSTGSDWLSYLGNSASAISGLITAIQAQTKAYAAMALAQQAGKPFPANIVAIASTLAVLTSAMNSVRTIGNFAEGGIVGGTNYQDGITARVSSGEMFINQADQKKLYNSIHSGNLGGGGGRTVVTGEQIIMAANNYGKRTGRGELLFGK